ncbi:hypothetical protein BRC63_01155 [Halobacteriales archaeon QH_10_70_21]|nr:MAG: hypothetical protein BRC63_01155 [Halobacteriales archaeon QH_10_70_21]
MRQSVPALILVVALVTSGCAGVLGPSRAPSDERAVDAVDRSRVALANVTSYRASFDGRVEATGDGEQVTVTVTGDVVVDVAARKMNATGETEDASHATGPAFDPTQSTYVDGYTASIECSRVGWARQNLSTDHPWTTYTPAGQQLALLNRTNVYWRGTETVDGTETAVVVAYPTEEELGSVPGIEGRGAADFGDANLENATVTVWLDTETDRPVRARREIRASRGGSTATAVSTFRFTDYDEPTTVTKPEFGGSRWETGCPGS